MVWTRFPCQNLQRGVIPLKCDKVMVLNLCVSSDDAVYLYQVHFYPQLLKCILKASKLLAKQEIFTKGHYSTKYRQSKGFFSLQII